MCTVSSRKSIGNYQIVPVFFKSLRLRRFPLRPQICSQYRGQNRIIKSNQIVYSFPTRNQIRMVFFYRCICEKRDNRPLRDYVSKENHCNTASGPLCSLNINVRMYGYQFSPLIVLIVFNCDICRQCIFVVCVPYMCVFINWTAPWWFAEGMNFWQRQPCHPRYLLLFTCIYR